MVHTRSTKPDCLNNKQLAKFGNAYGKSYNDEYTLIIKLNFSNHLNTYLNFYNAVVQTI